MAKAWVERDKIFITKNANIAPYNSIDVPDDTTPDKLKIINGNLKLKSQTEVLQEKKHELLRKLDNVTKGYIEKYYQDVKQRSDIADKEYCAAMLLNSNNTYTVNQLYKDANTYAQQILDGFSDLQSLVDGLPKAEQLYWKQLIKVAVRIGWVIQVKNVYRQIKKQIKEATTYSQLPQIREDIFPEYPKGV